jgi:hypothetical protein
MPREEWALAQGKKVEPAPLRLRRSRRSRPPARSSHERPRGRGSQHTLRGRVGGRPSSCTRGAICPAKQKKPWRRKSGVHASRCPRRLPPSKIGSPTRQPPRWCRKRISMRGRLRSCSTALSGPMLDPLCPRDRQEDQSSETAAASYGLTELTGERRSARSGEANRVIRPHAMPPTIIALMIENAWRQPCDGTPISARPSVA